MKTLALLIGLAILVLGVLGVIVPDAILLIGRRAATPVGLYIAGLVRVAIGLVLLAVAPASRYPIALRVLGALIFLAGLVTPLFGVDRARAFVEWWTEQGRAMMRLWGFVAAALGFFIAFAVIDRHGALVRRARRSAHPSAT